TTTIVNQRGKGQIHANIESKRNCAASIGVRWDGITGVSPGKVSGYALRRIRASGAQFELVRAANIPSAIKGHQAQHGRPALRGRISECGVEYEAVRSDRGCDLAGNGARRGERETQHKRQTCQYER